MKRNVVSRWRASTLMSWTLSGRRQAREFASLTALITAAASTVDITRNGRSGSTTASRRVFLMLVEAVSRAKRLTLKSGRMLTEVSARLQA